MDDIFKSIKAYLYDRAASPLFGAFIIAWSIWNYRVFVIIFTGERESIVSKFNEIDALFKSFEVNIWNLAIPINGTFYHGFLIPALLTISYLYLYPFLAKPVYEHSLKKQKELREIKQEEEKNRLLSVEESREIYKRLSEMQAEHERDVESYTKQISSLNQSINDLEGQLSSEVKQADSLRETKFDDINDADIEEFDNAIRTKIESFDEREFQLSDLFTTEQWTSLNSTGKQAIGKRLKMKVDRGDFVGVSAKRKGSGNQQIYTKEPIVHDKKKSADLTPEVESILQQFTGFQ